MIVATYENRRSIKQPVKWPYLRKGQMHYYPHLSMLDKHLLKKIQDNIHEKISFEYFV